jgi:hypothetical protein
LLKDVKVYVPYSEYVVFSSNKGSVNTKVKGTPIIGKSVGPANCGKN